MKESYLGKKDKYLQGVIKSWEKKFPISKTGVDIRMAILDGYEIGKTGKIEGELRPLEPAE